MRVSPWVTAYLGMVEQYSRTYKEAARKQWVGVSHSTRCWFTVVFNYYEKVEGDLLSARGFG